MRIRYVFVPLERRAAILYEGVSPGSPPQSYAIDWHQFELEETTI